MRSFTAMLTAATVLCASAAMAEENAPAPENEFRLRNDFGMLYSREDDYTLTSYNFLFAPEYEWQGRLVLTGLFRLATTTILMKEPGHMPFDVGMSMPWQFSMGGAARFRVYVHKYFDASLYGEFEFPLSESEASIDTLTLKGDAAAFASQAETLKRHVKVKYLWRKLYLGMTVRGHFGRWRPFIDFGYFNGENRIVASFDQEATDLFTQAEISPDRYFGDDQSGFLYATGTDLEIWQGIRLRLSVTVIPLKEGIFATGQFGAVFPIDLPKDW